MEFNKIKLMIEDRNITINSLEVSKILEQRHEKVIRKIRENEELSNEPIFRLAASSYVDAKGEKRIMYTMSFDGALYLISLFNNAVAKRARIELLKSLRETQDFIIQSNLQEEYVFFRQGGKRYRSLLMMTIEEYLPNIQDVKSIVTNLIYKNLFGQTTKEIRQERGVQEGELTRDYFSSEELYKIKKAEEYIRALIVAKDIEGLDQHEIMYAIEFQLKRVVINNR